MKLLIDMNLSPRWVGFFAQYGWDSRHWSQVGDPRAPDNEILAWAKAHDYILFTHDLDFGAILAATQADGPSVIQVRTQDIVPEAIGDLIIKTLQRFRDALATGALISIDPERARVRILPLRSR